MSTDDFAPMTPEELAAEGVTALPDKEVVTILDLAADVDLAIDGAAPIHLAVALNANDVTPIDAAVSANLLSDGSRPWRPVLPGTTTSPVADAVTVRDTDRQRGPFDDQHAHQLAELVDQHVPERVDRYVADQLAEPEWDDLRHDIRADVEPDHGVPHAQSVPGTHHRGHDIVTVVVSIGLRRRGSRPGRAGVTECARC